MPNSTVLVCTVGGSHQPIVSAIEALRPVFVSFICTGKDPGTGKPGSDSQINGKGNIIKARSNDAQPSLPNIPAQAKLAEGRYELRLCLADDLDDAYRACFKALRELKTRFPESRLVADYTGGTKTMSAGLVAAALELDGVELQLVTGNRADLVKVRDGWQSAGEANTDEMRLIRQMRPFLDAWGRFAYAEAAIGLAGLPRPRGALGARLAKARDLSLAYAAWDRFEHREALERLQPYAPVLPDAFKTHIGWLQRLCGDDPARREPALLFDLYRNAERRAAQGRYDDAVARIYRLVEWTAQWLLRRTCGVETGDLPEGFAPGSVELTRNREGRLQAGLFAAWTLVEAKTAGEASRFIAREKERLRHHIQTRNQSLLAHGFVPIGQEHWAEFHAWLERQFLPMLLIESRDAGIRELPPQLPNSIVEWIGAG